MMLLHEPSNMTRVATATKYDLKRLSPLRSVWSLETGREEKRGHSCERLYRKPAQSKNRQNSYESSRPESHFSAPFSRDPIAPEADCKAKTTIASKKPALAEAMPGDSMPDCLPRYSPPALHFSVGPLCSGQMDSRGRS